MKVSEITLAYAKDYLNIPEDYKEDIRIQAHINTAISYVMKTHGFETIEEMDEEYFLVDLVMYIIQQLYDTGGITDINPIKYMSVDRRF